MKDATPRALRKDSSVDGGAVAAPIPLPDRARPKRTRRKSGMREELLKAAVELFGSRGFEAVSLRDITAEVGLKPPAYHQITGDEEYAAAVRDALRDFRVPHSLAASPLAQGATQLRKAVGAGDRLDAFGYDHDVQLVADGQD